MNELLTQLKAIAEPTRLRILAICGAGELTVSELTRVLGQSQPRVSRHLKLLCDAGLLTRFREGTWVFYRLTDTSSGTATHLSDAIVSLLPANDPELNRDRQKLAEVRQARKVSAELYFNENAEQWDEIRALHVDEAEVERRLDELVAQFIAEGPTEDELERAKSNLVASAIFQRDSQMAMAQVYGSARARGDSLESVAAWPDEIESVTADQVRETLAKYIAGKNYITTKLLREEG